MNKVLESHDHICDDCLATWKHVDETCNRNYKKVLTCNMCAPATEIWAEMARNMPIPHNHVCVICQREWGHNDKKCAIEEHYWLECETCMTFVLMHACPKCGTPSPEELMNSACNVIRCVCPKCRHYFAPPDQSVYAAEKHFCPKCGREAHKIKTNEPSSVCYSCSDCEYYFYAHGEDVGATQEVVQPNSVCPRCGTRFTADEKSLGICPECAHHFRLYNGSQHQDENEVDEYDDPTGVG